MRFGTLFVSLLLMAAIGCAPDRTLDNPVSAMGLLETTNGRQLADAAVRLTNSLRGPDATVILRTSWNADKPNGGHQVATVYLVNAAGAPPLYMVVVPSDCGCVFIQPQRYAAWVEQHSTALSQMLEVSPENVLAFMLLHEVGHIANGDRGEFNEDANGNSSSSSKEREERADAFAVDALAAAVKRTKDSSAWLNAENMEMDLANLSWNVQALRQSEYFGSTVLGTPAAFADAGYTHPNFELRILTVNNQISKSETSRQLLESFLASRNRKSAPVLFKR